MSENQSTTGASVERIHENLKGSILEQHLAKEQARILLIQALEDSKIPWPRLKYDIAYRELNRIVVSPMVERPLDAINGITTAFLAPVKSTIIQVGSFAKDIQYFVEHPQQYLLKRVLNELVVPLIAAPTAKQIAEGIYNKLNHMEERRELANLLKIENESDRTVALLAQQWSPTVNKVYSIYGPQLLKKAHQVPSTITSPLIQVTESLMPATQLATASGITIHAENLPPNLMATNGSTKVTTTKKEAASENPKIEVITDAELNAARILHQEYLKESKKPFPDFGPRKLAHVEGLPSVDNIYQPKNIYHAIWKTWENYKEGPNPSEVWEATRPKTAKEWLHLRLYEQYKLQGIKEPLEIRDVCLLVKDIQGLSAQTISSKKPVGDALRSIIAAWNNPETAKRMAREIEMAQVQKGGKVRVQSTSAEDATQYPLQPAYIPTDIPPKFKKLYLLHSTIKDIVEKAQIDNARPRLTLKDIAQATNGELNQSSIRTMDLFNNAINEWKGYIKNGMQGPDPAKVWMESLNEHTKIKVIANTTLTMARALHSRCAEEFSKPNPDFRANNIGGATGLPSANVLEISNTHNTNRNKYIYHDIWTAWKNHKEGDLNPRDVWEKTRLRTAEEWLQQRLYEEYQRYGENADFSKKHVVLLVSDIQGLSQGSFIPATANGKVLLDIIAQWNNPITAKAMATSIEIENSKQMAIATSHFVQPVPTILTQKRDSGITMMEAPTKDKPDTRMDWIEHVQSMGQRRQFTKNSEENRLDVKGTLDAQGRDAADRTFLASKLNFDEIRQLKAIHSYDLPSPDHATKSNPNLWLMLVEFKTGSRVYLIQHDDLYGDEVSAFLINPNEIKATFNQLSNMAKSAQSREIINHLGERVINEVDRIQRDQTPETSKPSKVIASTSSKQSADSENSLQAKIVSAQIFANLKTHIANKMYGLSDVPNLEIG